MNYIKTTDKRSGEEISLSYKDYGQGRPIVLIHGWPATKDMWEYQIEDLVNAGFRVIKYDRRGFGKSSKPWTGYDYNSLTDDLAAILEQLDLQDVVLCGFSMGGGEVARYFTRYGGARVSKTILVSTVLPYMLKTDDNPDGVDGSVFEKMLEGINDDRQAFMETFGKQFFGVNLISHPVSNALLNYHWSLAMMAAPQSTKECAKSFAMTDFRNDVPAITVPTLIIHGDSDKVVPIEASSDRTSTMISNGLYKVYEGAPHGLFVTHKKQLNADIIEFSRL